MTKLTRDQKDCLADTAKFIEESKNDTRELVTLIGEEIGDDFVATVHMDRTPEEMTLSAIFTYVEALAKTVGDKVPPCPCEHCHGYRAKLDLIKQIIKPN